MSQETLEEAAKAYAKTITNLPQWNEHDASIFIAGAKWQAKKMYSEEEVLNLLNKFAIYANDEIGRTIVDENTIKWFEENKKK